MHTWLQNSIYDTVIAGTAAATGTISGSTYVDARICQNTVVYANIATVTAGSANYLEVLAATNEGGSSPVSVGTVDMSAATAGFTGAFAAEVRTAFLADTYTHITGRVLLNTGGSANVSIWTQRLNLRNLPPDSNGVAGSALFTNSAAT